MKGIQIYFKKEIAAAACLCYKPDLRGSCKTALPGKVDDLKTSYKWQQSCHAPFDEVGPKWAGQGEWMEMAPKGRFCWANEFSNCLLRTLREKWDKKIFRMPIWPT